ncbi:TRAF3-interacting protein 1 [Fragariocoptes setiger]|uniref:TRAF3-interacting protein 1 n=1 Tax=Fragariocoptes setiger TaxID=1670756 RepID=A0ABQ7S682_9ACAR|nr:TRAF3-interacting protein 1 [Fragariocoptes setiger]
MEMKGKGIAQQVHTSGNIPALLMLNVFVEFVVFFEHHVAENGLAFDFVWKRDSGRLGHRFVFGQRRLHLGRRQQVAGNVEHIVGTSQHPIVAVGVAAHMITGSVIAGKRVEISVLKTIVIAVDGPSSSRPFSSTMAGCTPKNGSVAEPGLRGVAPGNGVSMGADVSVCQNVSTMGHRRSPTTSIDRLASGAQQLQRRAVVTCHVPVTVFHQRPNGRGRRVEYVHLMILNDLPQAARIRMKRCALEQCYGGAVAQCTVHIDSVAGDPTQSDSIQIKTLRRAESLPGVQNEQRILGVHPNWFAFATCLGHCFVPPNVSGIIPRDRLEQRMPISQRRDGDVGGDYRLGCDFFELDKFVAAIRAVGSHQDGTLGVDHALRKCFGRESGKLDGIIVTIFTIPEVVSKTKLLYESLLTKPLSEKQLQRPPFKFIQELVKNIIDEKQVLVGMFSPAELNTSSNLDKQAKIAFVQKLITFVNQNQNAQSDVKASKLVAGLEPDKTNGLLQALATIIVNKSSLEQLTPTSNSKINHAWRNPNAIINIEGGLDRTLITNNRRSSIEVKPSYRKESLGANLRGPAARRSSGNSNTDLDSSSIQNQDSETRSITTSQLSSQQAVRRRSSSKESIVGRAEIEKLREYQKTLDFCLKLTSDETKPNDDDNNHDDRTTVAKNEQSARPGSYLSTSSATSSSAATKVGMQNEDTDQLVKIHKSLELLSQFLAPIPTAIDFLVEDIETIGDDCHRWLTSITSFPSTSSPDFQAKRSMADQTSSSTSPGPPTESMYLKKLEEKTQSLRLTLESIHSGFAHDDANNRKKLNEMATVLTQSLHE